LPHYRFAAHHVGGSVGQTFSFQGLLYTAIASLDDPDSNCRMAEQ